LVAAVLTERASRHALLRLNGGDLDIEWRVGDGHVIMTGPAEEAFRGAIEVDG
jgi:diaminopimelate epimerase